MTTGAWQTFGYTVRGPARDLLETEDAAERDRAVGAYEFAKDKKSEAILIETRQVENEIDYSRTAIVPGTEGEAPEVTEETVKVKRLDTEKRETVLEDEERARVILTAVYGAEGAKFRLEEGLY